MIGGIDYIVSLEFLIKLPKLIKDIWPDAIVEDTNGKNIGMIGDFKFTPNLTEVFIYQDMETSVKWEELGAEPELADTMIHIIVHKGAGATIVVDTPDLLELLKLSMEPWPHDPKFKGNGRLE